MTRHNSAVRWPALTAHGCLAAAFVIVSLPVAGQQIPAEKWRIDSTGTYICPPVDRFVTLEQAIKEKLTFSFNGPNFEGAYREALPPGPCHSIEDAAKIDQRPLPLCPSVDRNISEDAGMNLREPNMRVKYDLHGGYEGVMHDVPDGPCRPRRPEEELLPQPAPRCRVTAFATAVPQDRALAIPGAEPLWFDEPGRAPRYVGATLPVKCANWQAASEVWDLFNKLAFEDAAEAQRAQAASDAALRAQFDEIDRRYSRQALTDAVQAVGNQLECLNDWLREWQRAKATGAPLLLPRPCR